MAGTWTVDIRVTNLAERIADVTGTRTETVGEVEVVWSQTLQKRRFLQDGKTLPQIRAEVETEFMALFVASLAKSNLERQITDQETTMADELNAMEVA